MEQTEDPAIWGYAVRAGTAIVTKDEDFAIRITLDPAGPPIVWIRIGNTTTQALLRWFEPLLSKVTTALAAGEKLIELV